MKPGLSVLALVKYLACCQEWIWSHSRSAMLTWILLILRSGLAPLLGALKICMHNTTIVHWDRPPGRSYFQFLNL